LDEEGIKDLDDLVSQFRLRVISAKEKVNGVMVAGKDINGVLGLGT
jgi:hypothetical protein